MIDLHTPSWFTVEPGTGPIVVLAPHGGRRHAPRQPGRDKVNDLHTATLAHELARGWGATSLVNATRDRNELDLNRIGQVADRAPWLLHLLAETLERVGARHGQAILLVVHGWNVMQPACDVGIGLRPGVDGHLALDDAACTVSVRLVAAIRGLVEAGANAGMVVTIGARYPAAHPNNLLQLFGRGRPVPDDPLRARLAALTASGRVEAVQLELGIPLRWPGARRERFVALLAAAFGGGTTDAVRRSPPVPRRAVRPAAATGPLPLRCRPAAERRHTLQFADATRLGWTSIESGADGPAGGRLLVSVGPDSLALFTGELVPSEAPWEVPPLRYEPADDGTLRVRYTGALLTFPTLTPFLDLERGLAAGRLVEARADLVFTPSGAAGTNDRARFGTVRGTLDLGGALHGIETAGIRRLGLLAPSNHVPSLRITWPGRTPGDVSVASRVAGTVEPTVGGGWRGRFALEGTGACDGAAVALTASCELTLDSDGGALALALRDATGASRRLDGRIERCIPVRRPSRIGTVIETIYALCRGEGAPGWLELTTERAAD